MRKGSKGVEIMPRAAELTLNAAMDSGLPFGQYCGYSLRDVPRHYAQSLLEKLRARDDRSVTRQVLELAHDNGQLAQLRAGSSAMEEEEEEEEEEEAEEDDDEDASPPERPPTPVVPAEVTVTAGAAVSYTTYYYSGTTSTSGGFT
jgi:hypothetical protein